MEPCTEEFCHVAEARGAQYRCQGECAYADELKALEDHNADAKQEQPA